MFLLAKIRIKTAKIWQKAERNVKFICISEAKLDSLDIDKLKEFVAAL